MRIKEVDQHLGAQLVLASILLITKVPGCPAQPLGSGILRSSVALSTWGGTRHTHSSNGTVAAAICPSSPKHQCQRITPLSAPQRNLQGGGCHSHCTDGETGSAPLCCLLAVREWKGVSNPDLGDTKPVSSPPCWAVEELLQSRFP